jgi:hypothetical protein
MAFAFVLPAAHAVKTILTLYEVFGVGHTQSLQQRCATAQQHLQDDLGPNQPPLPLGWLFNVSAQVCERLFWCPGEQLKDAVSLWAALLLQEKPMAAFFALLLALVKPRKRNRLHS